MFTPLSSRKQQNTYSGGLGCQSLSHSTVVLSPIRLYRDIWNQEVLLKQFQFSTRLRMWEDFLAWHLGQLFVWCRSVAVVYVGKRQLNKNFLSEVLL